MTLVGFLGCCGAIRESSCVLATVSIKLHIFKKHVNALSAYFFSRANTERRMSCYFTLVLTKLIFVNSFVFLIHLLQYFLLCVTMCVACGAAVWWSTENQELMKSKLQNEVLTVVREKYGKGNPGPTESIVDSIQRDFACCGLKGYQDWANSFYNQPGSNGSLVDYGLGGTQTPPRNPNERFKLPASCCSTGVSSYDCERFRTELNHSPSQPVPGIHVDGCWLKFNRYIEEQWKWLIIVAVLVIGVQFFALILSCCLCCAISRSDDK